MSEWIVSILRWADDTLLQGNDKGLGSSMQAAQRRYSLTLYSQPFARCLGLRCQLPVRPTLTPQIQFL